MSRQYSNVVFRGAGDGRASEWKGQTEIETGDQERCMLVRKMFRRRGAKWRKTRIQCRDRVVHVCCVEGKGLPINLVTLFINLLASCRDLGARTITLPPDSITSQVSS